MKLDPYNHEENYRKWREKNSQIHLYLETELLERLKKQADENNISVSEVCRRKLKDIPQLNRIEALITEISKKSSKT